ncbi:uncharacterized protein LOC123714699 [Pieris brassicae]|uniref:uncharacterized protein LOC123714699 n=1 Tax=Pieris brassicae TaxID=7116 RepID=UPI001E6620A9|nr:uncharacterized protein LOC123714699 [Pieris brassicae]
MVLILFPVAENKEAGSEACTEFLNLIKKLIKPKEDANTSDEVTKKPKTKKFEERLEKYFDEKFPWWPSKLIEDLDATTEKPTTKATPVEKLVTSYMDFLSNLLKIF